MPGLNSGWACVRWMGFKANGLGLRSLGVDMIQSDHETKLVTDLAGVDSWFLPAILTTSGKRASDLDGTTPSPGRWPKASRGQGAHLSCNKLNGHFDPGGKRDFSGAASSVGGGGLFFEEFPAFPDFTIPFRGGMEFGVDGAHVTDRREDSGIKLRDW